MEIYDFYSRQQKTRRGEFPDVYQYEEMPDQLRIQVLYVLNDLNQLNERYVNSQRGFFNVINRLICREQGWGELPHSAHHRAPAQDKLYSYFQTETDIELLLDVIQLAFSRKLFYSRAPSYNQINVQSLYVDCQNELNQRFKDHGFGYQVLDGEIIRIDDEFTHAEIVKPTLQILRQPYLQGAQTEFLNAYEHYRKGRFEEAINECLKAFESTMKSIYERHGWHYSKTSTVDQLISIGFDKELIPRHWKSSYNNLRTLLSSSVPTGRNFLGGHGRGTEQRVVSEPTVAYLLHMTASAILFLGSSNELLE